MDIHTSAGSVTENRILQGGNFHELLKSLVEKQEF